MSTSLCRFPGASPRLSRPVSCSLRYGERSPQVSAGFRPCRRSSTGARSSSKRPCERCFLAAVIFLAAALPRVVVPCLRTVGCLPRIAAFAFRGRARTALPCCARSCYRADDKPIAGFCIANTYYFDDFINKKNCKSAKILENGEKRRAYILYFRKNAYLCSPFWTMEIDFLTIKGQFKKCQLFNS